MFRRHFFSITAALALCLSACGSCSDGKDSDHGGDDIDLSGMDCGSVTEKGACDHDTLKICRSGMLASVNCAERAEGATCTVDSSGSASCTAPGASPDCGSITEKGACDHDTLKICRGGMLASVNCSERAEGATCIVDGSGSASCTAPGASPDCGSVTAKGACDQDILKVCVDGMPVSMDCTALGIGGKCLTDSQGGADCGFPDACGDVPVSGTCDGKTLQICRSGTLSTLDCAETLGQEAECRVDAEIGIAACVLPQAETAVCESLGQGACDDSIFKVCGESGELSAIDCAALGGTCGRDSSGAFGCQFSDACGSISEDGTCVGSVLKFCDEGLTFEVDCAKFGFECGYDEDFEEDTCIPPSCGSISEDGTCVGSVLKFCADGLTFEVDCAKFGFECGYDEDFEEDTCIPPSCGSISEDGTCVGNVLKFCDDGLTFEVDCAKFGFECGYDKDFEEDTCLMPECKGVPEEGACDGNTLKVCLGGQVLEMNCSLYDSRCGWDEDFEEYDCL